MKKLICLIIATISVTVVSGITLAVEPDEILDDPILEERARVISQDLRCLVCQNQSIDDSNADLAKDLRIIVRERLVAGDSNSQVKDYLVERYGNYVLLKPPVNAQTSLLWLGPLLILIIALVSVFFWYRGRNKSNVSTDAIIKAEGASLSAEEKAQLDALLKEE